MNTAELIYRAILESSIVIFTRYRSLGRLDSWYILPEWRFCDQYHFTCEHSHLTQLGSSALVLTRLSFGLELRDWDWAWSHSVTWLGFFLPPGGQTRDGIPVDW